VSNASCGLSQSTRQINSKPQVRANSRIRLEPAANQPPVVPDVEGCPEAASCLGSIRTAANHKPVGPIVSSTIGGPHCGGWVASHRRSTGQVLAEHIFSFLGMELERSRRLTMCRIWLFASGSVSQYGGTSVGSHEMENAEPSLPYPGPPLEIVLGRQYRGESSGLSPGSESELRPGQNGGSPHNPGSDRFHCTKDVVTVPL
jgi:hypothetical protein